MEKPKRVQHLHYWLMAISAIGVVHFVIGFVMFGLWIRTAGAEMSAAIVMFALPYLSLLLAFCTSFIIGVRHHRAAIMVLLVACALSGVLATYDFMTERYQVHITTEASGSKHIYVFWWWYGGIRG